MSPKSFQPRRVAFGGVIAALCLAVMFLSGIFPFAEYAVPAVAGILLTALVIDFGKPTAWLCWGAVALLSLLVVPNKESALLFTCLFGPYPILKSNLEHLKARMVEWVCKLAFFNITIIGSYLLLVYAFGMTQALEDMTLPFGIPLEAGLLLLLVLGNGVFVLYDYVLSGLIAFYLNRLRPRLKIKK